MRFVYHLALIWFFSVVVSITQFFFTGVYGKMVFWPLFIPLVFGYLLIRVAKAKGEL